MHPSLLKSKWLLFIPLLVVLVAVAACGDEEPAPAAPAPGLTSEDVSKAVQEALQAQPSGVTPEDVAAVVQQALAEQPGVTPAQVADEIAKALRQQTPDVTPAQVADEIAKALRQQTPGITPAQVADEIAKALRQQTPGVTEAQVAKAIESALMERPGVSQEDIQKAVESAVAKAVPAPPPAAPVPAGANRLRVGLVIGQESMHPAALSTRSQDAQYSLVFETLTEFLDLTKTESPMLATSWTASPDFKTWNFKLREGVPWHYGYGEVTADDLLASWVVNNAEWSLNPHVNHLPRYIPAYEKVNDLEFKLNLAESDLEIISNLSITFHWNGVNVSTALLDEICGFDASTKAEPPASCKGLFELPKMVGTGPYQFVSRESGSNVLYERVPYEHYRVTPDFDEIELVVVPETATRYAMLLTEEVDITLLDYDLGDQAVDRGFELHLSTSPGVRLMAHFGGMYIEEDRLPGEPLHDVRVREAINRALDRNLLLDTVFGGRGTPMYVMVFYEGMPGWDDSFKDRYEEYYGYDPDKARALLAEAGYDGSHKFQAKCFEAPWNPVSTEMCLAMVGMWQEVGLELEVTMQEYVAVREKFNRPNTDTSNWLLPFPKGGVPTPVSSIVDQYTVNSCCQWYVSNYTEERVKTIIASYDLEERERLLNEIAEHYFTQYATIPLFWQFSEAVANPATVSEYTYPGLPPLQQLEYVKAAK